MFNPLAPQGKNGDHDAIVRTTLNINDALLKELWARSAESGQPFRRVVEEVIAAGLAQRPVHRPRRTYRIRPHALRLKAAFRNLSLNQVYDQMEAEATVK